MNLKGAVSISLNRSPRDGMVHIEVTDKNSKVQFLELKIDSALFVSALGGLYGCECELVVTGLDKVGKIKEQKDFEFEVPSNLYGEDRERAAIKVAKCLSPKGWIPSEYYGSQNSFFTRDGKQYARTTICRWVDAKGDSK